MDIRVEQGAAIVLRLTTKELTLVTKALSNVIGTGSKDDEEAKKLAVTILEGRARGLRECLELTEGALEQAVQIEEHGSVVKLAEEF